MLDRRARGVVWLMVLAAACGPAPGLPAATPTPSSVPVSTSTARSLPPAFTPTPSPTFLPTLAATPPADNDLPGQQRAALKPGEQDILDSDPGWTRYAIRASVTLNALAQQAAIQGLARIVYTNPQTEPLADLVLMLWPNDRQYKSSMQAGPALIGGKVVPPTIELGGLAVRYRLPAPLKAGESLDLSVPFEIQARGDIGGPEPGRFGLTEGVLFAPTFYPLVPRLIDGQWEEKRAPSGGDTTNSDIAVYTVELTVPADAGLAASGVEVARQAADGDSQTVTYVTGPVRDFAFAVGPFVQGSVQADGVTIQGWVLEAHRSDLSRMLRLARDQLDLLSQDVGPYPYTELDVVDVPGAFGGIEYPGLVTIGTVGTPDLEIPVIHEVAHQWFYGLIGDDQLEQPWLDEAAATYASVLFLEHYEGNGRATGELSHYRSVVGPYFLGDLPIGLGVGDYPDENTYALIVYWKGALFFDALRQRIGDQAFFAFLKAYYAEYRYSTATSQDFQASAEAICSCDLQALFDLWVYKGGAMPVP